MQRVSSSRSLGKTVSSLGETVASAYAPALRLGLRPAACGASLRSAASEAATTEPQWTRGTEGVSR